MKKYYLKINKWRIRVPFVIYRIFYRFKIITTQWESNNLIGTKSKFGINSEIKKMTDFRLDSKRSDIWKKRK